MDETVVLGYFLTHFCNRKRYFTFSTHGFTKESWFLKFQMKPSTIKMLVVYQKIHQLKFLTTLFNFKHFFSSVFTDEVVPNKSRIEWVGRCATFVFMMAFGVYIEHFIAKRSEQFTPISTLYMNFSHRFLYRMMKEKILRGRSFQRYLLWKVK